MTIFLCKRNLQSKMLTTIGSLVTASNSEFNFEILLFLENLFIRLGYFFLAGDYFKLAVLTRINTNRIRIKSY